MKSVTTRILQINTHVQSRSFGMVSNGSKYTTQFKQYLKMPNGEIGSYFHDVPINLDTRNYKVNMVVEIPRWSNGKFEISKEVPFNPIVQDVKNGKVRFVNNIFPFKGYIHNYGAIPQTWEDPTTEEISGLKGDNDPLDCCEIGSGILSMGDIKEVKILGSLALIDDGEMDWKILTIDINDPLSCKVNNLSDVQIYFPGLLESTKRWFKDYKIPTGKPENKFAYDGKYIDAHETLKVIEKCHKSWRGLINGEIRYKELPEITQAGTGLFMEHDEIPDSDIPSKIDKWYYI